MAKYSKELRFVVVMVIENGETIRATARKCVNVVRGWWRRYRNGGIELISTPKKYLCEFNLYAIEYRWSNVLSYSQATTDLGIRNRGTL